MLPFIVAAASVGYLALVAASLWMDGLMTGDVDPQPVCSKCHFPVMQRPDGTWIHVMTADAAFCLMIYGER